MKIGIITQPLHSNYGGLMQNYALQKVLSKAGHEVYTINKNTYDIYNDVKWYMALLHKFKRLVKKAFDLGYFPTFNERRIIRQHCTEFVRQNIAVTEMYISKEELAKIVSEYRFDAYVVGSDQVWRPCYSNNIYNDFLSFCENENNVKRIAYAASFGVSEWEFSEEQTRKCRRLVDLFDAVSVREDSGVGLCKEFLGVEPELVLDPTLLLEKEEYIELIKKSGEKEQEGDMFCYIFNNNRDIENVINEIERKFSLKSFQVRPKKNDHSLSRGDNINNYIIPSPIEWLRAFVNAKVVFTDSYHGCVFSIIFNKPFWALGNMERGNARFESLLKIFNLEDRLISLDTFSSVDINSEIDWSRVNTIKKKWQEKSMLFINSNL